MKTRQLLLLLASLATPLSAQVTTAPVLGPAPALTLPKVERDSLSNGLQVVVSRNAEVPLMSLETVDQAGIFSRAWDAVRLWAK